MKANNLKKLNEPKFLTNLKYAKSMLLELRQQKIKNISQQKDISHNKIIDASIVKKDKQNNEETLIYLKKIEKKEEFKQKEQNQPNNKISNNQINQVQVLSNQINTLGKDLFEINQEVQAYEVIFDNLCAHFENKRHISEENDFLKKESFKLKENIQEYKSQIKKNYEKIATIETQNQHFKEIVAHQIKNFTIEELSKSQVQILESDKQSHFSCFSVNLKMQNDDQQENSKDSYKINLRFKEIKHQLAKKSSNSLNKKTKVFAADESSLESFYKSEICSI